MFKMQQIYACYANAKTIVHVLSAFHSLRALHPNSVLYLLCLKDSIYQAMEQMEYDDIYIISLSELEERYPKLLQSKEHITPKKYTLILHAFLLHYLLHNNPLIHTLFYINPYTYWFKLPVTQHTQPMIILQDNNTVYTICCHNTANGKSVLESYILHCLNYALDTTLPYQEQSFFVLCSHFAKQYPYSVEYFNKQTLLFTQYSEHVFAQKDYLYSNENIVLALYTRYLLLYPYMYCGITNLNTSHYVHYEIKHHLRIYRKELLRIFYKCRLFGINIQLPLYTMKHAMQYCCYIRKNCSLLLKNSCF